MIYYLAKDSDEEGRICLFQTEPDKIGDLWFAHSAGDGFIDVTESFLPQKGKEAFLKEIEVKPVSVEIKLTQDMVCHLSLLQAVKDATEINIPTKDKASE